jgi:hypothetical protein
MTLLQQNSDYHKYNGKVNASFESFSARRDAFTFQRIGKQKDFESLILSNLVVNPKVWAGNLLDDSARQVYLDWKKRQDSLTHHFKSSLSSLDDDLQSNFIVHNGQYPHLVDLYLQKRVSLEVTTILVKLTNSKTYWDEKVVDKVLFPDIMTKIDKYNPFINYSKEKMTICLKDHFF